MSGLRRSPLERVFATVQQMADGTLGGRIRSASPVQPSRAALATHKKIEPAGPVGLGVATIYSSSGLTIPADTNWPVPFDSGWHTSGADGFVTPDFSTDELTLAVDAWVLWQVAAVLSPSGAVGDYRVLLRRNGSPVGGDSGVFPAAFDTYVAFSIAGWWEAGDVFTVQIRQNTAGDISLGDAVYFSAILLSTGAQEFY